MDATTTDGTTTTPRLRATKQPAKVGLNEHCALDNFQCIQCQKDRIIGVIKIGKFQST